ncbi:DUF1631 domain-containing protein [Pseudomonas fulva]|uniref:DUF1631 domain-containing protein n=1 Tax=Pseudomonas fulva TaxID=47880 RepID=UPI0015E48D17|nr:DUF1631 domain-containing protein [Pseudomonas fulva]MBA1222771.1 DUF1631 domain-containing protein [Pseudomonas fulva]MBN4167480.1 DUF1631 domain-containing protein [Pseudomonas fulva]
MHKEGKVVPLAAAEHGRRTPPSSLPIALLQVRDQAALQLRQGLQALFDNADDTLFEMADKAADRFAQHLYFEAMRDLRLKRKSIERLFLDTVHEAFARLVEPEPERAPATIVHALSSTPGQSERAAAVEAMVARVKARDGVALQQLGLRLQTLLERHVPEQCNPLNPIALCRCFLEAGQSLGVGPRVKLVLLKLFERYVLCDAQVIYGEANRVLIAAGVLGQLPPTPCRRAGDSCLLAEPDERSYHEPEAADDTAGEALFASLQPLLRSTRGVLAPRLGAPAGAQQVSRADLLRLLSHLQHYVPEPGAADDFVLGQQLEQLLLTISVRSGTRRFIGGDDEDMINLIEQVFRFIASDDNLPICLRAVLARLQIPLLKVALLDRGLLSRASHPARRLLNELAAAGLGCDPGEQGQGDALQLRAEHVVQRLLIDFAEDSRLFGELLEDFLGQTQHERRRTELFEQRTRDAEEGRANASLARRQVQQVLSQRLRGRVWPQAVVQMLSNNWSQVMMLAWLRHGETSLGWRNALQTLDTLLASVMPSLAPQVLMHQVPPLLKSLRDGLASVGTDSLVTREFFRKLQQLHLRAYAGDAEIDEDDILVTQDILVTLAEEADGPGLQPAGEHGKVSQKVQRLRMGTWIEVSDDGGIQRCKLVARLDSCDKLVFANRSGMKVREWSGAGLDQALEAGTVRVLDDGPLFERALEAVIETLRRSGQAAL